MDPSLYKDLKTSRGVNYHYYYHPASDSSKPTLLLLHGFPSTSTDWARVAEYFSKEGYGVLVPDLFGYGGTDKPTDPDAYRMKNMTKDIIDILDAEKLNKVVTVSHDWGSGLNSRLAVYYPDRIYAFAFFAVGYVPPAPFDVDAINAASIEKNGYANFGYWKFFAKEGADKTLLDHLESFFSLIYGKGLDGDEGKKHFCPEGALEEWLLADRKTDKLIINDELKRSYIDIFSKNGFAGPLCWYKAYVFNLNQQDDAKFPQSAYPITQPVYFGACTNDPACVAEDNINIVQALCPNATIKEFNSSHWVLHEYPSEVNEELKKWLNGLKLEVPKKSSL